MFIDTGFLKNDIIQLKLEKTVEGNEEKDWVPAYHFAICNNEGTKMGVCDLRIGHNDKLYYGGNIGYSIEEEYRGNHYAAEACLLLFKLAKKHNLEYVIITCNPDNIASRKTCEYAGGELLEIVELPEDSDMRELGETQKCIFKFWMSKIRLINVKEVSMDKVMQFRESFLKEGEKSINGSRGLHNYEEYTDWINLVKECEKPNNKLLGVQASTYFAIDENEKIVGCIELRHSINENLATIGGHIGYSVCPSERRKGYATNMLKLVLEEARRLGLEKVLLTCDADNIASRKTIVKNGGVLEREAPYFYLDEQYYKFWIYLKNER